MADKYVTVSGETWDEIAYKVYGDEHYCDRLMDRNRDKLDYFIFPDGITLTIPYKAELASTSQILSDYPTWRAMLNG